LILFQAANLRLTITNGNGEFELGEALAAPQVFQQIAKRLE
jgi:hypothetical protein